MGIMEECCSIGYIWIEFKSSSGTPEGRVRWEMTGIVRPFP